MVGLRVAGRPDPGHSEGMRLYSDFPVARLRQIVGDAIAVVLIVLAILLGSAVHRTVLAYDSVGRQLQQAGSEFSGTMGDAAEALDGIPFVGDDVRRPFDDATGTGQAIARAGADQQRLVARLATALGLIVAVVPIALVLRHWLVRRIGFARRAATASALSRSEGGLDLLALRALGGGDPADVLRVSPDAAALWRAGEPATVHALARLALGDAGVRMP
jgi:hypothetical protein